MPTPTTAAFQTFAKFIFYFDLANPGAVPLSLLSNYVVRYGAKHATFLDKNVTHLVTDKASTIAEAYSKTIKWKMTVWSYNEFIVALTKGMELNGDHYSLGLIKKALASKNKDLMQCLAEERQLGKHQKVSRMVPLYGGTATKNAKVTTNVKTVQNVTTEASPRAQVTRTMCFQPFQHPFVLIEEGDLYNAPFHKQYPHTKSGRATYPQLCFNLPPLHCPFFCYRPSRITEEPLEAAPLPQLQPQQPVQINKPAAENLNATQQNIANNQPAVVNLVTHTTPKNKPKPVLGKRSYQAPDISIKAYIPKPRPGYCECCLLKYDNLLEHIKTDTHRQYAQESANYAAVDRVMKSCNREMLYDFNPIPYWKTGSSASMMSPTHSCIASSYSKKGNNAKLSSGFLANDLIEDKENGLAIALDFPDLDQKGDDKFTLGFGLSFDLHSDTKRRKGRRELSKLSNTPYFYP